MPTIQHGTKHHRSKLLARGDARSGDACRICGYSGSGDKTGKAIAAFAVAYADQTDADYPPFGGAMQRGRIKADSS